MRRASRDYGGAAVEEREWARILMSRGHTIVPMSAALGNTPLSTAPLAEESGAAHRLPDFLSFRHQGVCRLWTEVKTKTQPGFMRIFNRWEHGIDQDKWQDYNEVRRKSGIPMFLVVHELNSPRLKTKEDSLVEADTWLYADIETLRDKGRCEPNWPRPRQKGWLWPRSCMEVLSTTLNGYSPTLPGLLGPI